MWGLPEEGRLKKENAKCTQLPLFPLVIPGEAHIFFGWAANLTLSFKHIACTVVVFQQISFQVFHSSLARLCFAVGDSSLYLCENVTQNVVCEQCSSNLRKQLQITKSVSQILFLFYKYFSRGLTIFFSWVECSEIRTLTLRLFT